jgi:hypothetical protein
MPGTARGLDFPASGAPACPRIGRGASSSDLLTDDSLVCAVASGLGYPRFFLVDQAEHGEPRGALRQSGAQAVRVKPVTQLVPDQQRLPT